jgi:hypothetical protein
MAIFKWGDAGSISDDDLKPKNTLFPEGEYECSVVSAAIKLTKGATEYESPTGKVGLSLDQAMRTVNPNSAKGNVFGAMLNIEIEMLAGDFEGKKLRNGIWFTLEPENPGLRIIKQLSAACGFAAIPEDIDALKAKEIGVKLKIEKGTGGYADKNAIVSFYAIEEQEWHGDGVIENDGHDDDGEIPF